MERIKAALEKAKQDKQSNPQRVNEADGAIKQRNESISQHEDLSSIKYDQTKTVKLDTEYLSQHRIVSHQKGTQYTTPFDLLRTQVLQKMKENNWRTLAITSPNPAAGKTVVSINLALSIAQQTETTALLIDFDLRRPKIKDYLGLEIDTSLNDVLERETDVKEALVKADLSRLVILPVEKSIENSSELLSSNKVKSLIKEIKNRYEERIIIFDLPPLLNVDDTLAVLPEIDCVVMVIANGMSTKKEITESMQKLGAHNFLGVVLNRSDSDLKHYYYGKDS